LANIASTSLNTTGYNNSIGSLTGGGATGGNVTLGAATVTIGGDNTSPAAYAGVISGTGAITKTGTGTLILSGSNTFSGATTVSAGTLQLGATGDATNTPLGTIAAGTSVSSGATLDLAGFALGTAEALSLNGTGVSGTSGALMNSGGATSYSGLISLAGNTTINGGTGTINISNTGTISGSGNNLILGGAQGGTFASILGTGAGTLTKADAGTWTLSGSSTFTGLTTISAGTLKLGANGGGTNTPLGTTGAGTAVTAGAVFDLAGYTLGTTEALTLNGNGISSAGVLINSGGTASYSGAVTLGSDATVTTNNQITLSGTISPSTYSLIKEGSNSLVFTSNAVSVNNLAISAGSLLGGTSTINVYGAFTCSGTFTANTNTVTMAGSGSSQTIPSLTYNNLTVNNSTGTTLGGNITVNGTLTLSSGILTTGSYYADLGTTGSIVETTPAVTAPLSYVTGTVKATRILAQNVNNTFGGIGVEINEANVNNNSTVVTRVTGTGCTGHFNTTTGILRYFTIVPNTDINLNGTMVFHYFDNEITMHVENNIKLFKSTDGRHHWTLQNSIITPASNTATLTGITSFSDWTASDATNQSLPIELTDFSTKAKKESVIINWTTATETNNDYFTLEQSTDGEQWNIIYTCQGAGTTTKQHVYSYIDNSPSNGINYYRLKQTDKDGQSTYSSIESVRFSSDAISMVIYPIPAPAEEIHLLFSSMKVGTASLIISDVTGRQMCKGDIEVSNNPIRIKLSEICTLTPGTYFVTMTNNDLIVRKKIIVQ
jgi:autotransporter-associated beta strand protein